ncbi:MAG: hypothetical protein H6631_01380 [Anaerolineaceae bacterium]|nr:hypothetical protein [Anaerolineaceae bacterium]
MWHFEVAVLWSLGGHSLRQGRSTGSLRGPDERGGGSAAALRHALVPGGTRCDCWQDKKRMK